MLNVVILCDMFRGANAVWGHHFLGQAMNGIIDLAKVFYRTAWQLSWMEAVRGYNAWGCIKKIFAYVHPENCLCA